MCAKDFPKINHYSDRDTDSDVSPWRLRGTLNIDCWPPTGCWLILHWLCPFHQYDLALSNSSLFREL